MKIHIVIVIMVLIFLGGCNFIKQEQQIPQVCFEDNCFQVEISDTDEKRQQGLMNRDSLASQSGMLFIFEQSYPHGFWMKNTLIPLDMIWIDEEKKIVDIQTAIPCGSDPCRSYIPSESAKYVLEINAGGAEWYDIQIGDSVKFI